MNTAILWDIENVTPPTGTNYIQTVIETISVDGKISYAMAFGDWNKNNIKNIAAELASNSFELIHVPASRKDSADMSMVAHGVELIFQYPHIQKYVLITGDADFRPLLLSLRKYGKETLIICDVKNNASEDLLNMADDYRDYREIIDFGGDDADDDDDEEPAPPVKSQTSIFQRDKQQSSNPSAKMTKDKAFELLEEALGLKIEQEKKNPKKKPFISALKVTMKLLNSSFNEKKLGYKSWKAFIDDAVKQCDVCYADESGSILSFKSTSRKVMPEVFIQLLKKLEPLNPAVIDHWLTFSDVSKDIKYRDYGYLRFKDLALDAEKRGIVQLQNKGRNWFIKKA